MLSPILFTAVLSLLSGPSMVEGRSHWFKRDVPVPAPSAPAALIARAASVGSFGSCTKPEISFNTGFDGRTETSFRPINRRSYDRGSALNIATVTKVICDTLTTCGADQTALDNCAKAAAAAKQQPEGTGAQADAFNAVFGLKTNFSAIKAVAPSGGSTSSGNSGSGSSATTTAAASAATTQAASSSSGNLGGASFGSCSVPQIEFAAGFDGRRETSFQPTDKTSYSHGSAQAIDIISQFVCDQLTNSCKANQAAKDLCQTARSAADGKTAKTGAQADAFNAVFGITTNFASVQPIDDQGRPVNL
ncbi:uncharacterized protein SCHCODRAFT_02623780 [Schizophyllum commune H4-8]|uniref:Uncharacterized protein n=1 Tax=Schizophyllum commune (strain H4-8 / FGSC 9210) TaxID=578458 RepID=D8PKE5_SCHCM|nr:uncharacterized protein SCHCODRAFT_02623780 [Schizophyllum commune H4-8]KAI5894122.1 hypothetical protein SCHCODRAFT_02623780 [Schizophyllum commune H4-8]